MSLNCDLCIVHVSCPFLCHIYSGVYIPDKCQEDPKGLPALLSYRFLDSGLWLHLSLSLYLLDTDPERSRSPAVRDRPGGLSTPFLLRCSYPRSNQAILAWTELGGPLRPEQIHRCVTCGGTEQLIK